MSLFGRLSENDVREGNLGRRRGQGMNDNREWRLRGRDLLKGSAGSFYSVIGFLKASIYMMYS